MGNRTPSATKSQTPKWERHTSQFAKQHMTGVMLFIWFGYYYKILIHLFRVPGYPDKNPPLYKGTDFNHWIELAFFCPLMWLCMHQMTDYVFSIPLPIASVHDYFFFSSGTDDIKAAAERSRKKWRYVTEFFVAYYFFAQGAHQVSNNMEMYARLSLGLDGTPIHEVIYFYDENLTHVMQFIPLYIILFLVTLHDAPGRFVAPIITIIAGVGHGVKNAIGIIEGNQPWIVVPAVLSMSTAAYLRWKWRYNEDTAAVWKDFFFRYMIMTSIMMSIGVIAWGMIFGLAVQSNELPMWQVAVFGIIGTGGGIGAMLWWDWDYIQVHRHRATETNTTHFDHEKCLDVLEGDFMKYEFEDFEATTDADVLLVTSQ